MKEKIMYLTKSRSKSRYTPTDLATGKVLGVASIAIGLTEILAPRKLEKAMGIGNGQTTGILRTLGVREISHGVDLLTHDDPAPGIFARVLGDMLDGVLLGLAARKSRNPSGMAAIFALVMPVVLADMIFAGRLLKERVE
jgi:fructose-specific phosphotransferase system IIC component